MDKSLRSSRCRRLVGDRAGEAGVALVEFALLVPFLSILVFGTVDIGRAYTLKNQVTNMAREGGFAAMVNPCPTSGPISAAKNENTKLSGVVTVKVVAGRDLSAADLSCSSRPATGSEITVGVTRNMTVLTPLVGAITGSSIAVRGTSTVVVQ